MAVDAGSSRGHGAWRVHKGGGTTWSLEKNSDIPFCLFLTLAKLFNRAPSTGANGCRLRVAMVEKSGLLFDVRGRRGAAVPIRAPATTQLPSELTRKGARCLLTALWTSKQTVSTLPGLSTKRAWGLRRDKGGSKWQGPRAGARKDAIFIAQAVF
jgi:hypothetical protein